MTRTGWTGDVGAEIYLRDGSRGDELWERISAREDQAGRRNAQSVGVEIAGDPIPFNTVKWIAKAADGTAVGHITSAVRSPRLRKNIGSAMLPTAHAALGTEFEH